jgi:hypothetical protein
MRRGCVLLLVLLLAAATPPLSAQGAREGSRPGAGAPTVVPPEAMTPVWQRPWVRPLASLLVPGSGQLLAHRNRGLAYLATEIWFVARALALSQQGRRQRRQFQALAYDVARRQFSPTRVDGPWEYYEAMSHWVESGAYNRATGGGFQPETDTSTYNGAMWLLARRNYYENVDSAPPAGSPAYQAALAFYQSRAFGDPYRWSWRDARLEMDVYRHEIQSSDNGYRQATNYLGAVLANHLVSAVDAFIMTRRNGGSVLPRVHVTENPQRVWLLWEHEF